MVKIRLKRGGTKKRPFYRIVVADSREKRDGKTLDSVGFYHPLFDDERKYKFHEDKIIDWYNKGARATETVYELMKKAGIVAKLRFNKNNLSNSNSNTQPGLIAGEVKTTENVNNLNENS